MFCRVKDYRRIATRYDKLATNSIKAVQVATSSVTGLRPVPSVVVSCVSAALPRYAKAFSMGLKMISQSGVRQSSGAVMILALLKTVRHSASLVRSLFRSLWDEAIHFS
jgi:hypothetical protein